MNKHASPIWLFDLDNTLHNTSAHIFPRIDSAMTTYIAKHLQVDTQQANSLREHYWRRYGATMLGLMRHHHIDPHHFLYHTHQMENFERLVVFEHAVRSMLRKLPGRKVVVSNGPHAYVAAVLRQMKVFNAFDAVFGIEQLGLHPKPQRPAFMQVLRKLRAPAARCIMVEDSLPNLKQAKRLGIRTIWISQQIGQPAYVDVKLRSVLQLRTLSHSWRS